MLVRLRREIREKQEYGRAVAGSLRIRASMRVRAALASPAGEAVRAAVAVLGLTAAALAGRAATTYRRLSRRPPRVVWGTTPILSIRDMSNSLRRHGMPSRTIVDHLYSITERSDFDQVEWWEGERRPVDDYRMLARVMRESDVVCRFFDGGFLRFTPLTRLELPLLRLAGCRIVATGYGSDIAMPGHQGPWEAGYQVDYPQYAERADEVRRQVDQMSRWATLIVRTLQPGYLPRWDVLWGLAVAVDADLWRPREPDSGHDGSDGPVSVVHAPNHRAVKGTQSLLDAVDALRAEGLQIELRLLEQTPNREVAEIVTRCDIVADQFNLGYQQFAVEGMSAGRPVLTPTGWWPEDLRNAPGLSDSPVVDTNTETVEERLRELVTNPELRREIGERSREHALRYHSLDNVGELWANLVDHAWRRAPLSPFFVPALRD